MKRLYLVEAISLPWTAVATRRVSPPVPLESSEDVPESPSCSLWRALKEALVLSDATAEDVFTQDPYVKRLQPLSVLCLPIIHRGDITGILYVEHRWLTGVFTSQRVEVLALLASQAAISIENARLYADLQSTQDEYRALYDNAIEGLFRISPDGLLVSANPTLAASWASTASKHSRTNTGISSTGFSSPTSRRAGSSPHSKTSSSSMDSRPKG